MINSDHRTKEKMVNDSNPWIEQHITAETDYQGHLGRRGARAMAEKLVRFEYQDAPPAVECDKDQGGCGGWAYYKATIGCMKCPDCGELFDTQGDKI